MSNIFELITSLLAISTLLHIRAVSGNTDGSGQADVINGAFARVSGTRFAAKGKPLFLNGFNAYWLMNMASDPSKRVKVSTTFQRAARHGLNIARTFGFKDGGEGALQKSPGVYDENVFGGLDFVVSEAKRFGVYLTISLVNNWPNGGGRPQYVQWARNAGHNLQRDDDFYTDPVVKGYYKNHVKTVLTRVNTITKVAYKDDPTIFAWELINEPRSLDDLSGDWLQAWIKEMAAYVKSLDTNHLLEIGLEGFYWKNDYRQINPVGYQAGTDFFANNLVPQIDFATVHLYPDKWLLANASEQEKNAFIDKWIQTHIEDSAEILHKPLIIDEFGMSSNMSGFSLDQRNSYFGKIYDSIYSSASKGGAFVGGLFWQLMTQGMSQLGDGYEVILENHPSTASLISHQSKRLSSIK